MRTVVATRLVGLPVRYGRGMGQMVSVVQKPSSRPGVVRFEANRSLTGQGHEAFSSAAEAVGPRPAAVLARRLFASGHIETVHMFGNQITVTLARGFDADGLDDVVRDLYQYWKPGMEMPVFTDEAAAPEAAASGAASGDGGGGADSEYLRRVPAVLVERSRAALAKWNQNR